MKNRALLTALLIGALSIGVAAQGTLSQQVLQLLSRIQTWTATQTFQDVRIGASSGACPAIPSTTTNRIYTDASCNLYWNGTLIGGSGSTLTPHNLLSTTHADTVASAPVRGGIIVANSTPAWAQLSLGGNGAFVTSNGTDAVWGTNGSALTNLTAANLTGTLPAISGANLTSLNASNLSSGTVPLAQLSGIANAQIAANAAIVYSKLSLTNSVVNADINSSAAIAYSKLNLSASVLTTDIAASTILFSNWALNGCAANQIPKVNAGATAWACAADANSGGTVTSAALTMPAEFTVSGSPITASGTFAVTKANETANTVFAGPTNGGAAAPTFRALVNADFPTSGVVAGTYPKVTVNAQGIVTAGAAAASLTADVSGVLPYANGGTGSGTAANHTTIVSSGSAWTTPTIPDCVNGSLAFTQATNLFSCATPGVHNLLSATHSDTLAASVVRGDLVFGNSTPKWARLALGTAGQILNASATDVQWGTTFAAGTITSSTPWTWTQTWNAGGVTFTGFLLNITDTSSANPSKLFDVQKGGTSQFSVDHNGNLYANAGDVYYGTGAVTISSGFGTGPSIAGIASVFRVTLGNPVSQSGVVLFNNAVTFANVPVCLASDLTTSAGNPVLANPTVTQVTLTAATAVAADVIEVVCLGR